MKVLIANINDINKYDPYALLVSSRDDEYFEAKFLEYYEDFCKQVEDLKKKLNHKQDAEIEELFNKVVKRRNDEEVERILNDYFDLYVESEEFKNEEEIAKLKGRIRVVKNLMLVSEPTNMKRLQEVDDRLGYIIDEVSELVGDYERREFNGVKIGNLLDSFNPSSTWDLESYANYVTSYKKTVEAIREFYRNNYSVDTATKHIRELDFRVNELLDNNAAKLGHCLKAQKMIIDIVQKYSGRKVLSLNFDSWLNEFRTEIARVKKIFINAFSLGLADILIEALDKKTGELIDVRANYVGMPYIHREMLKNIFASYKPDELDIFSMMFYSSDEEREKARYEYQRMTPEQKNVFEMRIYEQYIRMFKAKIRDFNKDIRRVYSLVYANKMVTLVNKKADKLIRDKAKEIGKPIPRNPWFIRKYLWADTENFMSKRWLPTRKLVNPLLRQVVKVAMNNKLIIEERPKLDPTKQYVFVPTHYFTEDIIGMYASLGRQAYVLMGTTDQIENNFLMLAAIALGLFYVDREDTVSRRECIDKQNRIIENGSNVVNYVGGSWENSENELQPLSFSGPYRTSVAKNVEVVPVGLYLDREEKKIYVRYGDPLDLSKVDEVTANEMIRDTLASMHFKQMSKHSAPIETIEIEGYGKTHNLPYDQHTYYMEQVGNEYWGQYWSKPFAKEEIGVRPKRTVDEADVYSFVDKLSRENLIRLSDYLSGPMLRRYERDERYNIVKYIDENYERFKRDNSKKKVRKKVEGK